MKKIYISPLAGKPLIEYLKQKGFEICFTEKLDAVAEPVAYHPDLIMCKLGVEDETPVFHGDASKLGSAYPADILYNACCTGHYFIHNLKYTAPELLAASEQVAHHMKKPLLPVSVPQKQVFADISLPAYPRGLHFFYGMNGSVIDPFIMNTFLVKKGENLIFCHNMPISPLFVTNHTIFC